MQQRGNKVPSTTAGVPPKKSNHMGWERVYLEQLQVINRALKRTQQELRGILDRITRESPEFQEKKKEFVLLSMQIEELEAKVEYHRGAQMTHKEIG